MTAVTPDTHREPETGVDPLRGRAPGEEHKAEVEQDYNELSCHQEASTREEFEANRALRVKKVTEPKPTSTHN